MLSCNLISLDTGNVALNMFLQEDHEIIDAGGGEGRRCMIFLLFNIFLYPSSPAGFFLNLSVLAPYFSMNSICFNENIGSAC